MNRLQMVSSRKQCLQKLPTFSFKITQQIGLNSIPLSHASILKELKESKPLQQVHACIITSGLSSNIFLCNRLMNSYASCGLIDCAQDIFSGTKNRNLVSWTILISGFTRNDLLIDAIKAFHEMILNYVRPNATTISSILPAFAKLGLTRMGKSVHGYWIRQSCGRNVFVETALVDMYMKIRCMNFARHIFDNMPERNLVSWNSVILGYSDNGSGEEAFNLFNCMRRKGYSIDVFTIMSLISASLGVGDLSLARVVHALTIRIRYVCDRLVMSALMDLYIKTDGVDDAYCIFNEISKKDIVVWTVMLSGFLRKGKWNRSIEHFNEMIAAEKSALDAVSLVSILAGCSSSGALQQGRRIHAMVIKIGYQSDIFVGSAVINMYANCAEIGDAEWYFGSMKEKDAACWNALISGYSMNGYGNDAIDLFLKMKGSGINPDEWTLLSVLCACSHAGMVDQGLHIFHHMAEFWNIVPNSKHYACVIDLLGRAGLLDDAYRMICNMHLPPTVDVYGAMLSACRVHRNMDMGVEIAQKLSALKPSDVGHHILLSNMYALAGNLEAVKLTRTSLRLTRLKKYPGFSSIEIDGQIYTFMASQKDHPQYQHISGFLKGIILKIKSEGYVPDKECVLQEVSDDMREDILYHHSEKLAIVLGLLKTKQGTVIRITKNLRTCNDCHSASKIISKVFGRALIIKDANRFHVFEEGICSCKDYW
nr:pentatricopeptide repeat-containing protein At3g12770-like [Coffea arabica]